MPKQGIVAHVISKGGKTPAVAVELRQDQRLIARHVVGLLGPQPRRIVLRTRHRLSPGAYELVLQADGRDVVAKRVKVAAKT